MSNWKEIEVRYENDCVHCGEKIKKGQRAQWSRKDKAIRHIACERPGDWFDTMIEDQMAEQCGFGPFDPPDYS